MPQCPMPEVGRSRSRGREESALRHDQRFPGESDEYRQARDELLGEELALRRQIEAVAAKRRQLPLGGVVPEDYAFTEWDGAVGKERTVQLSALFANGKDALFVYSFMFRPGEEGEPLHAA